jgi:plasmid stabilization system protein ParE
VDFQVVFTDEALTDLQRIVEGVADDNPEAAEKLGLARVDHAQMLGYFPFLGTPVVGVSNVRKLLHTPYKIYYRVQRRPPRVSVLHFWHGARDEAEF